MIVSTVPASESLQVLTTAIIQITFSTPMNESTVNGSVIVQPRTGPPPSLSYSWAANDSLFVTPVGGLVNCTTYTVLVFAGKDLNGTDLVSGPVPNPWRFMTWCDKPFILSTTPRDGEIGVRNNTDIVVRFSTPVDCTNTRPRMSNVVPPIGGSGNDLCSTGNTVWTFTLTNGAQFLPNTTYAVTISAQDQNGSDFKKGNQHRQGDEPARTGQRHLDGAIDRQRGVS